MARTQDVEIDLGAGRLLGLFFGLVVICALFFTLGYSLGKNSGPGAAVAEVAAPPAPTSKVKAPTAQPAQTPAPAGSDELTFYKRVGQKEANPQLTPDTPAAEPAPAKSAPEMPRSSGTYTVQVAAVTKQEDAQALVGALKKKNYPVFVNNNSPGDKLFHVQVGPFGDLNQAEDMRAKLAGDGYNPIVKK